MGDPPLVNGDGMGARPFDSMCLRVGVATAFEQWLLANGHTEPAHCSGCQAYYGGPTA